MLYSTHHVSSILKMLLGSNCPMALDSEMQAEINITTKGRLTMACVSAQALAKCRYLLHTEK